MEDFIRGREQRATAYLLRREGQDSGKRDKGNRIVGTAEPAEKDHILEDLKKTLKDRWSWQSHSPEGPNANPTELLYCEEIHGVSLASLDNITLFRDSYKNIEDRGEASLSHIDKRLRTLLPDLVIPETERIKEETSSWDYALLGIIAGLFTWDAGAQRYKYATQKSGRLSIGSDYEDIAFWLRAHASRAHAAIARKQIDNILNDIVQDANNSLSACKESRDEVMRFDLILELLGEHRFKDEKRDNGVTFSPPEHTMIRRIRYRRMNNALQQIAKVARAHQYLTMAQEEGEIRERLARELHRFVMFVGPEDQRLIARTEEGATNTGDVVLHESFDLGWFPKAAGWVEIKQLFSQYEDGGGNQDGPAWRKSKEKTDPKNDSPPGGAGKGTRGTRNTTNDEKKGSRASEAGEDDDNNSGESFRFGGPGK